jgi:hypothetical protein
MYKAPWNPEIAEPKLKVKPQDFKSSPTSQRHPFIYLYNFLSKHLALENYNMSLTSDQQGALDLHNAGKQL